jgi:hypothetical protein
MTDTITDARNIDQIEHVLHNENIDIPGAQLPDEVAWCS